MGKDLKDHFIGMNLKQKVRIKIEQMNIDNFSNQILFESIDCLFQFIQINMKILKDLKLNKRQCLPYIAIINGENLYAQAIDFDIKRYEKIRILIIGWGGDYITGRLLDYHYVKNHYRLKVVDLSRQKVLDADQKTIQQIEFVGQLNNLDDEYNALNADGTQSMFILTILEKKIKMRIKFSRGSVKYYK